ncbi:MAG: hypothetical protein HZC55_07320 [Verrucomicrobia bacterium]|nr:hypothetical protein [Verrucomicrobiota bacterium]
MSSVSKTSQRRLRHASGYIGLGMWAEADRELATIPAEEQGAEAVLAVRTDRHLEAKEWERLVAVAEELTRCHPTCEQGWIHRAFALRELQRIAEAKAVLLEAEPLHGRTSGVLHYNLACYHCLLGERPEARRRFRRACQMNPEWKESALQDSDLAALHAEIRRME